MYRTASGQETELAILIRECMTSACWQHDAATEFPFGKPHREMIRPSAAAPYADSTSRDEGI